MEGPKYTRTECDSGLEVQCTACGGTAVYTLYAWFHGDLIDETLEQCHFEHCELYVEVLDD